MPDYRRRSTVVDHANHRGTRSRSLPRRQWYSSLVVEREADGAVIVSSRITRAQSGPFSIALAEAREEKEQASEKAAVTLASPRTCLPLCSALREDKNNCITDTGNPQSTVFSFRLTLSDSARRSAARESLPSDYYSIIPLQHRRLLAARVPVCPPLYPNLASATPSLAYPGRT